MICAQLKPAVSGLERDFPGKVTATNVDASEPEAREAIRKLGFRSHGLVIRSTDARVLWKRADHTVQMEEVKEALHEILGS
jgi:hypothetical protein